MKIIGIEEHIFQETFDHPEARLKDMDEAGIDMQVLSTPLGNTEGQSAAAVLSAARNANDRLAKLVEKYPARLAAFAALPLQYPEDAAGELERSVTQLGAKGTMTGPEMSGRFLDEPEYQGLLEMAEKLDVPIYIHPNSPPPDMIKPYMTYPILSHAMWGYAAEAGLHAMRLICSGAFDQYPRLKIILGHMGESIPYYLWRIDNQWVKAQTGVLPGLDGPVCKPLKRKPGEYFKDNFYVTTSGVCWPLALQFVNSALGADRILFATDYPLESAMVATQFIKSAPISDQDKNKICHLNAEKLLKL